MTTVGAVDKAGLVLPVSIRVKRLEHSTEPRCLVVIEPVERPVATVHLQAQVTPIREVIQPRRSNTSTCLDTMECCCVEHEYCCCRPFIRIQDKFDKWGKRFVAYIVILTLIRLGVGLWTVITEQSFSCNFMGVYCLVKGVKESIFIAVVWYLHRREYDIWGTGRKVYHAYLVIDLLVSIVLVAAGAVGAGIYGPICVDNVGVTGITPAMIVPFMVYLCDVGVTQVALILAVVAAVVGCVLALVTLYLTVKCIEVLTKDD